jgi:hypothetical protein
MLVALLAAATATIAPLEWTVPSTGDGNNVVYGGGTFIKYCVSECGVNLETSLNGIEWDSHNDVSANLEKVTYGGGLFVNVQGRKMQHTSSDGVNWNPNSENATETLDAITYGNGGFVAVGGNNVLHFANGGMNWTSQPVGPADMVWQRITYGNGKFIAAGRTSVNNTYYTIMSNNGVNWSDIVNTGLATFYEPEIAFGADKFVLLGSYTPKCVVTSSDGITWSEELVCDTSSLIWNSLVYGNGMFIAVGNNGMMTSPDGSTWTTQTVPITTGIDSVAIGSGTVVAYGNNKLATATIACANDEAFYVQPQQEYIDAYTNAYCVPTAAGNMLAATLGSSFNSYPSNNMYDYYDGTWWDHTNAVGLLWFSNVPLPATLGGVSCNSVSDTRCALDKVMGTNFSTGTTIPNARTGLATYLRFLNQPYKVIHDENTDNTAYPSSPFMLHLRAECVDSVSTPFTQGLDTNIKLVPLIGDDPRPPFYGSSLGHTVVVYEATDHGLNNWTYRVASGLAASRTANDRTCADSIIMNVINVTECVEGWTGIEYVPPLAPQPSTTTVAPAPKKDKKKDQTIMFIVIAVVVFLLIICAVIWYNSRDKGNASSMTDTFL